MPAPTRPSFRRETEDARRKGFETSRGYEDRARPDQGNHRWLRRATLLSLAPVLALGCSTAVDEQPASYNGPTLARYFESSEPIYADKNRRGRWVQKLALPATLEDVVDLPSGAMASLFWSLDAELAKGESADVTIEISLRRNDEIQVIHSEVRRLKRRPQWFEENLDFSQEAPGEVSVEIRIGQPELRTPRRQGKKVAARSLQATGLLAPLLLWSNDTREPPRPDIILIAIDTLRADHLSCYGGARETPNIDALAASGTLFEQAFSPSSWTLPSFASIFTATYPWTHGASFEGRGLPSDIRTLPEYFAEHGYRTSGFYAGGWVRPNFGFNRGFDDYSQVRGLESFDERVASRLPSMGNAPLLLFFHTYDVHAPYTSVPQDYHDTFTDPDYVDRHDLRRDGIGTQKDPRIDLLEESDLQFIRDLYDGEIQFVDDTLQEVLAALDLARPGRPRIVVLFSDHGESFGEGGRMVHTSGPVLELARVPLILAGTGIPEGRRISEITQTLHLLPTLVELAGLPIHDEAWEVDSLLPYLQEEPLAQGSRGVAYSEGGGLATLRTEAWTLTVRNRNVKLYDRRNDPDETRNVANDHPERVDRLLEALKDRRSASPTSDATAVELDDETIEELRALGYLN